MSSQIKRSNISPSTLKYYVYKASTSAVFWMVSIIKWPIYCITKAWADACTAKVTETFEVRRLNMKVNAILIFKCTDDSVVDINCAHSHENISGCETVSLRRKWAKWIVVGVSQPYCQELETKRRSIVGFIWIVIGIISVVSRAQACGRLVCTV